MHVPMFVRNRAYVQAMRDHDVSVKCKIMVQVQAMRDHNVSVKCKIMF